MEPVRTNWFQALSNVEPDNRNTLFEVILSYLHPALRHSAKGDGCNVGRPVATAGFTLSIVRPGGAGNRLFGPDWHNLRPVLRP
jgi:hypothetical protein